MKTYPEFIKRTLYDLIRGIADHAWLYSNDPCRDFTRNRKLSFEKTLIQLIGMGGAPMRNELMDYFQCSADMPSVSAFVQRRSKIMPEVLAFLFHEFTNTCVKSTLYKGYRLLAADGTDLQITANPNDKESYYPSVYGRKHYSMLHLNALYDLMSRTYLDAFIQKSRAANENAALVKLVDRLSLQEPAIVIADRGYESYNNLAHIEQRGWKYLIRIKAKQGIMDSFKVPDNTECDFNAHIILTKKQTNEVKQKMKDNPGVYRLIPSTSPFDFLDLYEKRFYELDFRIVRFMLPDGSFETLITNLDAASFSPCELKKLYFRRWGIETSFRQLKYTVGLDQFQSKKMENITQEIFARLIMYNFCELITSHVVIQNNNKTHAYQANFAAAVHICRQFLRGAVSPPNVEALIVRFIVPIRPGRNEPRVLKPSTFRGFLYRIA